MSKKNQIYNYLLTFPGVAGVPKNFQYKYVTSQEKRVLPPRIPKDDIYPLFYNKKIKYIAFPLTMYGELSKLCDIEYNCPKIINNQLLYQQYTGTNEGSHNIALLYDKETTILHVIDYEFGLYNIFYNYEAFMNTDLLEATKPFFETYGIPIKSVNLPMFKENKFYHIKKLLQKNNFPHDFSIIYKAYLANYLHDRNPKIAAPQFIDHYLSLCKFMKEFPYDSKWIPLSLTQTKLFEFTKPCPKGYMRDFFNGDCVPIPKDLQIDVLTKYLTEGKPVYPDHPLKWVGFIIKYLKKQYPNVAMMEPESTYNPHPYEYAIQFNDTLTVPSKHPMTTRTAKTRMKMILPPQFDSFMDQAISDTKIRFIMFLVSIKYEGSHSSPVIIDKDTFTIERIEVNAPFIEPMGTTLEDDLDTKLKNLFASYLPDFTYIPPLDTCPYGLHRAEYVERTENVADIGGRCAEWAIYYLHLKLANEDHPTSLLASYAFEELRKIGSIKHLITGYTTELIKEARRRKPILAKRRSQIKGVASASPIQNLSSTSKPKPHKSI